jgi:WD40 repeat protein
MFSTRRKSLYAILLAGYTMAGVLLVSPAREAPAAAPPGDKTPPARKDLYGDPLPPRAVVRLGTVRFRHIGWGSPYGLAFSRDGRALLSASEDGIRLWNSRTGEPLRHLPLPGLHIRCAAFSPDGQLAAVGVYQFAKENDPGVSSVRVLDASSGKELRAFSRGAERGVEVSTLAFTPDSKVLVSLGTDGVFRLEEIATGTELLRHKFQGGNGGRVAVSADGAMLAICPGWNTPKVFLWEWQAGQEPRELKVPPNGTRSLALSPDGKTLATGDDGQEGIRFWAVANGKLLLQAGDRDRWSYSDVCFSPDGRYLASTSSRRQALVLRDARTGKEIRSMAGLRIGVAYPVFSPDSRRLAAFGDRVIRIWDVETGKELVPLEEAHREPPSFVALLNDGTALTGGDDHTVRVWDTATGRQRRQFEGGAWLRGVAVSPDERWLATSELGERHAVVLWDLRTGREVYRLAGHGRLGGVRTLAFTPDSKRLASWGDDMYLRVWEVRNGKALLEHQIRPDGREFPDEDDREKTIMRLNSGVFSRDASRLVVGEYADLFLFDVKQGRQQTKIPNPGGHIIGMAVSPDGRRLLVSAWGRSKQVSLTDGRTRITTEDPLVCLLDIGTGKEVRRITVPDKRICPVAFSADGSSFAFGDESRILVHRTASGERCGVLEVPGFVRSLNFSPDGRRLIAGLSDTTAVIFDLPSE